jgi:hypothetical protein
MEAAAANVEFRDGRKPALPDAPTKPFLQLPLGHGSRAFTACCLVSSAAQHANGPFSASAAGARKGG